MINEIAEVATINRRDGTPALENYQATQPFPQQAISYRVANVQPEFIEASLANDIKILQERHDSGKNIFKGLGASAPAFGMIGTLIGVIQMMASMSDPSQIGLAMAVALLTTFYGALLANLVFLPIADKLTDLKKPVGEGVPAWMATFADLMSLRKRLCLSWMNSETSSGRHRIGSSLRGTQTMFPSTPPSSHPTGSFPQPGPVP